MCRPSPMLGCLPLHQCSSTLIGNSKALCSANPAILNTFELNVRSQSIKASTYTQTWPMAVTRNYTRHQCNPSHQTLPLHQILQHIGDGLSGAQMSLMAMMHWCSDRIVAFAPESPSRQSWAAQHGGVHQLVGLCPGIQGLTTWPGDVWSGSPTWPADVAQWQSCTVVQWHTVPLYNCAAVAQQWQSGATQLGAPGAAGSREAGKVRKEIHKYTNRRKWNAFPWWSFASLSNFLVYIRLQTVNISPEPTSHDWAKSIKRQSEVG